MESLLHTLSSAPSEAWVGLLGVVFGSLLTTLGVWLTNRSNREQLRAQLEHDERLQRQRLSKERLEELYVLVCHWQNGMLGNYLSLTLVMKGQTDYNQHLDTVIKMKPSNTIDFSRLEMIVGIYGGTMLAAYAAALKCRDKVNDIAGEHKQAYRLGEPGQRFLKPFMDANAELEAACESFKAEIADAARAA